MEEEFIINENTKIGFGKLKGKSHSALLQKENERYKNWIVSQGELFRYANTREWILREEASPKKKLIIRSKENQTEETWDQLVIAIEELLDEFEGFEVSRA